MNFILWLKRNLRQNPPTSPPDRRNLCLLVVFNGPLVLAWLNTLNNKISEGQDRCWKDRRGLRVWNATDPKSPEPDMDLDGVFVGTDVVLITAATLQCDPSSCWVTSTKWHTVLADEGHEFLRGQHNSRPGELSLTLRNWYTLQHKTTSIFVITGTPFVTKISYDVVAITKAVARESVRRMWGPEYTDAGLSDMVKGWRDGGMVAGLAGAAEQEQIRDKIKDKLALFMIRRDENSRIRGEPVMTDYFKNCRVFEQPLVPTDNGAEFAERERLYKQRYSQSSQTLTKARNDHMRCLCWSYRFFSWTSAEGQKAQFWADFTLKEAQNQIRTRALIDILKRGKKTGNGVIVFVQRTFQAELCVKASHPFREQ